jgi:SpoVK/Ycf46/Vps4 family AAA+-type ATPase
MLELPAVPGYGGPIAAYVGPDGGITGRRAERAVTIVLDHDPPHRRLRHWLRALGGYSEPELADLAEQVSLPGRYIRQAAELAAAYASLERRERITRADVQQATRALGRRLLETLAERLEPAGGWEHLVVAGVTAGELRAVERRCQHREHLVDTMGSRLPGGLNRGVRVLFEGPSGTGKTLAARVLAAELGLDLYRVDLAAVVNKYIGETEKNLSRVLSRAEDLDVILLLDEGDALMTRRTDVRSANDRYANLETNYLLQRLDTYTGIIVVTTNAGGAIDSAFERRMDVVVQFHPPDAAQRQRLWQLHLPSAHALHADAAERTALRYALTGGQIRNAAVNATLLALARGEGCVCEHDVESSIQAEYRKAGAAFPQETWTSPADDTVAAFLDAVS